MDLPEFTVSFLCFGPTEMRIGLIVCSALLVKFGIQGVLPWIAGCGVVALAVLAYRAQQKLWRRDMLSKSQEVN